MKGLAISADGALWVAVAYAGEVRVFEIDGTLRRRIEFPVPMVTSLCFGGTGLNDLYALSFKPIFATWTPWKRAPASSFSLGIRSPSPPAMVDAP